MKLHLPALRNSLIVSICCLCLSCTPSSNPAPAGYYGTLICHYVSGDLDSFGVPRIDSVFEAYAAFTATPGSSTPAFVDSITINGLPMETLDSIAYDVFDIHQVLNFTAGAQWDVKGANGIPSFSYNYTGAYPRYMALPDTIVRATAHTFLLNNTAAPGVDSMTIELDLGGGTSITRGAVAGGGITFTAAELSASPPIATVMEVNAFGRTTQTFSGKDFYFIKARTYYKAVYLK